MRRRPTARQAHGAIAPPETKKAPRGGGLTAAFGPKKRRGGPKAPSLNAKKHPLRAERPILPRPGAAVLSAKRGLTAEFGMGSGDPPLCGSARGGCSPRPLWLPARAPWRLHARSMRSRHVRSRGWLSEELGLLVALA